METFKLIAAGTFLGANGPQKLMFPQAESLVAGFYTTRIILARDCDSAMQLAADQIESELRDKLGTNKVAYELEFESCDAIDSASYEGPRKGFTFFTETT